MRKLQLVLWSYPSNWSWLHTKWSSLQQPGRWQVRCIGQVNSFKNKKTQHLPFMLLKGEKNNLKIRKHNTCHSCFWKERKIIKYTITTNPSPAKEYNRGSQEVCQRSNYCGGNKVEVYTGREGKPKKSGIYSGH
jgi:hypothetical protein